MKGEGKGILPATNGKGHQHYTKVATPIRLEQ